MVRHIILTDVHGNLPALEKALGHINFNEDHDVLICLGDTIDRGSHTRECMERFASLREHGHSVVMLAGNHEALLIEALQGNVPSLDMWLAEGFGSRATLSSYGFDLGRIDMSGSVLSVDRRQIRTAEDVEQFLLGVFGERHLALIRRSGRTMLLKDVYPGVDGFLCHAGLTCGMRIRDTSPSRFVWGDVAWVQRRPDHPERLIIIHGHFHGGRPIIRRKAICLAIEDGVAIMSLEERLIVTSAGERIEIRREQLGV